MINNSIRQSCLGFSCRFDKTPNNDRLRGLGANLMPPNRLPATVCLPCLLTACKCLPDDRTLVPPPGIGQRPSGTGRGGRQAGAGARADVAQLQNGLEQRERAVYVPLLVLSPPAFLSCSAPSPPRRGSSARARAGPYFLTRAGCFSPHLAAARPFGRANTSVVTRRKLGPSCMKTVSEWPSPRGSRTRTAAEAVLRPVFLRGRLGG